MDKTYLALVEGVPDAGDVRRLREGFCWMTAPRCRRPCACSRAPTPAGPRSLSARGRSQRVPPAPRGQARPRRAGRRGSYVEVRLREGRNRQVRRMLEAVGHPVIALHREAFGPLVPGDLPRGASRPLAEEEAARLKELAS
ncbi:MAG: hypothetical protein ACLTDR_11350 [Adlercreutzia equolifaciens]